MSFDLSTPFTQSNVNVINAPFKTSACAYSIMYLEQPQQSSTEEKQEAAIEQTQKIMVEVWDLRVVVVVVYLHI